MSEEIYDEPSCSVRYLMDSCSESFTRRAGDEVGSVLKISLHITFAESLQLKDESRRVGWG